MNKKVFTIVFVVALITGIFGYTQYQGNQDEKLADNSPTQENQDRDKPTAEIPIDWEEFSTSSFSFNHPPEAKVDTERGQIRLRFIGPDSQMGGEITDGFTFYVDVEDVSNSDLEDFVNMKYQEESRELIEEPHEIEVKGREAYRFKIRTELGVESTKVVLGTDDETKAFVVSFAVQDPNEEGYEDMIEKMMKSMKLNQ